MRHSDKLWVVLILAVVALSGAGTAQSGCPGCFQATALSDISGPTLYHGFTGGLYGGWSNQLTPTQSSRVQTAVSSIHPIKPDGSSCTTGAPSQPCKILMLTIGMSIGKFEWSSSVGNAYGNFISPQNADQYSVLWRLGEAVDQPTLDPPYFNPYFYVVVGNINGHFAASWINDNPNGTLPGDYHRCSTMP